MGAMFYGGPLGGQEASPEALGSADQAGMLNLEELAAGVPGGPGGASEPEGEDGLDEGAKLDRVISDLLALAGGGTLTEQSKSKIQKAMTVVQDIKAAEEKESQDMMGGKMSPRLMSKAYGGAGA